MEVTKLAQKRAIMDKVNEGAYYKRPRIPCIQTVQKGYDSKDVPVVAAPVDSSKTPSGGFLKPVGAEDRIFEKGVMTQKQEFSCLDRALKNPVKKRIEQTFLILTPQQWKALNSKKHSNQCRPKNTEVAAEHRLSEKRIGVEKQQFSCLDGDLMGPVRKSLGNLGNVEDSAFRQQKVCFSNHINPHRKPTPDVLEDPTKLQFSRYTQSNIPDVKNLHGASVKHHIQQGKQEHQDLVMRRCTMKMNHEDNRKERYVLKNVMYNMKDMVARKHGRQDSSPKGAFLPSKKSNYLEIHETKGCKKDRRNLQMEKYQGCVAKTPQSEPLDAHTKVKTILSSFRTLCRKFVLQERLISKPKRVDLRAYKLIKENVMWFAKDHQFVGNVPGIEIGDEFYYRVELCLVGLHGCLRHGIDYKVVDGKLVATCVVSSGGYSDVIYGNDVLIYVGHGGQSGSQKGSPKATEDQKLTRGNLALKNSLDTGLPVRVVHGIQMQNISGDAHFSGGKLLTTYIYDGLYKVERYWAEPGRQGFSVFKFLMRRIPDQPPIAWKEILTLRNMNKRHGLCVDDISKGTEKRPICVVNMIDDELPDYFRYATKLIYRTLHKPKLSQGCNWVGVYKDSRTCDCARKNDGEFPFNFDKTIVGGKPLIHECGPCRCPPSCYNRVREHGIRFQLEIFKTRSRGWGVRSLESIPSGSFVCEYTGELLEESEAEKRTNTKYMFAFGKNYNNESLREGLLEFIPCMQKNVSAISEDTRFTIDAALYGNVARFINHSSSPNLYVQNLYDRDDKNTPHVMLFAAENIPALKELTYHYNYNVGQVVDFNGNVKRKACKDGAIGCTDTGGFITACGR